MAKIKFARLTSVDFGRVQSFHRRVYGADSYQANSHYLRWLYLDNPFREMEPTCLAAVSTEGAVVGCIHVMRLAAEQEGRAMRIHSLQNLIVDEEYRSGAGILMVKQAMQAADITLFPGVAPELAKAYKALKYPEVESFWGRKLLRPMGVAWGLVTQKLGHARPDMRIERGQVEGLTRDGIEVFGDPDDTILSELAMAMRERDSCRQAIAVLWTAQALRWRFFSEHGPFHLLFMSDDRNSYCIASLGLRRNVRIARLVEMSNCCNEGFFKLVLQRLKSLGAELSLSYASRNAERDILLKLGYYQMPANATSFVVGKGCLERQFALTGGATDVGLESLNTITSGFKRV